MHVREFEEKRKRPCLTNETEVPSFESSFCDGTHEHAAWGVDENNEFNTAKEAQYPQGFCDAYCDVLLQLVPQGMDFSSTEEPP